MLSSWLNLLEKRPVLIAAVTLLVTAAGVLVAYLSYREGKRSPALKAKAGSSAAQKDVAGVGVAASPGALSAGRDVSVAEHSSQDLARQPASAANLHASQTGVSGVGVASSPGAITAGRDVIIGRTARGEAQLITWGALAQQRKLLHLQSFDWADASKDSSEVLRTKINDFWLPNEDEIWTSTLSQGAYVMTNRSAAADVRYKYFQLNDEEMSNLGVAVEVRIEPQTSANAHAAAGIVYRVGTETKEYYAYVIAGDGTVRFLRQRVKGGYKTVYAGRVPGLDPHGYNRLGILCDGDEIRLFVDDRHVYTEADPALKTGQLGVIAMSTGQFFFDNLAIYSAEEE